MNGIRYAIGRYFGGVAAMWQRAGIFGWLLMVTWLIYPVAVFTVIYPSRALNLQHLLQGQPIEHLFTWRALTTGLVEAVVVLLGLSLCQLVLTVLIYRRAQIWVTIWPLALILIGIIANGIWWIATGRFDLTGALIGATPFASGVIWHAVCEHLGADFVFGKGNRPQFE